MPAAHGTPALHAGDTLGANLVEQGTRQELLSLCGLQAEAIAAAILRKLGREPAPQQDTAGGQMEQPEQ